MDNKPATPEQPVIVMKDSYFAYVLVAFISGFSSLGIVFILFGLNHFSQLTDAGLWAMAAMVFAPALMGIGVSYFVHKTSLVGRSRRAAYPDALGGEMKFGIKE